MTKEELIQEVRGRQMSMLEFADIAAQVEDDATLANLSKSLNYIADKIVDEVEKDNIPVNFI